MTEIKPSELTAEERALVDSWAISFDCRDGGAGTGNQSEYYRMAFEVAAPAILARRALFAAPASEEKVEPYSMPEDLRKWAWRAVEMLRVGQATEEERVVGSVESLFQQSADELAKAIRNHPRKVDPEPAATEMPEAVRNAINSLRACATEAKFPGILRERADDLSIWARAQVEPKKEEERCG